MTISEDTRIYSSDLKRAAETASIISTRLGLEVCLEAGLREIYNGVATGMSLKEAQAVQLPRTQPIAEWVPYQDAESWHGMVQRVFACMDKIEASGSSHPIIVGHGGSLGAIVRWWIGPSWSTSRMWEFGFDSASFTWLGTNMFGERQVSRLNDSSHLVGVGFKPDNTALHPTSFAGW